MALVLYGMSAAIEILVLFHLTGLLTQPCNSHPCQCCFQIKKTSEATLTTIQDMVTIEDYDVSECFHHSRSTESVKSTVSETYLSKPSIAKRRANQQETEQFYFMVREMMLSCPVYFVSCR